jgi:hypothetical protein
MPVVLESEEHLHRRLSRLDGLIRDEFEYVGQRLTWLLTSHSFLFTAFVVGLNVGVRDRGNIAQRMNPTDAENIIPFLLGALCVIGIVSSVVALLGIVVAHKVVGDNYRRRKATEDVAAAMRPAPAPPPVILNDHFDALPNRQRGIYILGSLSGWVMPCILAIVWFSLLLRL